MRAVIDWLLAQRYRLILLAIAFAPFVPPISTALLALETVRRGASQGLMTAGIAVGGVLVLTTITGASPAAYGAVGVLSFLSGVLIGALLLRSQQGFSLSFQWLLLLTAVVTALLLLSGGDGRGVFAPLLDQVVEALRDGGFPAEQIEGLAQLQHQLTGIVMAMIFLQLAISLILAHWWSALADRADRFGAQFRQLRLSRPVGLGAVGMLAIGLVLANVLVQNLSALVLIALMFQGLAVLHAWAHARQWHPVAVAPVYVLMVTPLMAVVLFALVAVGVVDNIFDLRAPLRSGA